MNPKEVLVTYVNVECWLFKVFEIQQAVAFHQFKQIKLTKMSFLPYKTKIKRSMIQCAHCNLSHHNLHKSASLSPSTLLFFWIFSVSVLFVCGKVENPLDVKLLWRLYSTKSSGKPQKSLNERHV